MSERRARPPFKSQILIAPGVVIDDTEGYQERIAPLVRVCALIAEQIDEDELERFCEAQKHGRE